MKRLFIYSALALATAFASCKKDDLGPAATNLDSNTFQATPSEGAVKLQWAIPDNANYKYVEVKYNHPGTKKEHTRLASVHADTILIDGLLAAYGDIEYRLTPVTKTGNRGTTHKITATCLPVPPTTRVVDGTKVEVPLSASKIWLDSHQTNDGTGATGLVDGNNSTYWHVRWDGGATAFPHYLVVELDEPVSGAISFYWKGRNAQGRDNPKRLRVLGSNTPFTGTTNDRPSFVNFMSTQNPVEIASVQSGMPDAQAADYNSATFILNDSYKYLWVEFQEQRDGTKNFMALAEWKFYKYQTETYNPETGETVRN